MMHHRSKTAGDNQEGTSRAWWGFRVGRYCRVGWGWPVRRNRRTATPQHNQHALCHVLAVDPGKAGRIEIEFPQFGAALVEVVEVAYPTLDPLMGRVLE